MFQCLGRAGLTGSTAMVSLHCRGGSRHQRLAGVSRLFMPRRSVTTAYPPPKRSGYPERLLIYHAGTGRTVFIGCLKLTTIFLFSFSCLVVAPAFYYAPEEPKWAPAAVIAGGAIPMLFVAYTTAPFVNYVHIRLPIFARQSREQLIRWSKSLKPTTEIDITTMRFSGRPRVSRMRISDLQQKRGRLGVANFGRTCDLDAPKRPWWLGSQPTLFYVGNERGKSREDSIWQRVVERTKDESIP